MTERRDETTILYLQRERRTEEPCIDDISLSYALETCLVNRADDAQRCEISNELDTHEHLSLTPMEARCMIHRNPFCCKHLPASGQQSQGILRRENEDPGRFGFEECHDVKELTR
jgi:hypothetical protein